MAKWISVLKVIAEIIHSITGKGKKVLYSYHITFLRYSHSSHFLVYNDSIIPQVHSESGAFCFLSNC